MFYNSFGRGCEGIVPMFVSHFYIGRQFLTPTRRCRAPLSCSFDTIPAPTRPSRKHPSLSNNLARISHPILFFTHTPYLVPHHFSFTLHSVLRTLNLSMEPTHLSNTAPTASMETSRLFHSRFVIGTILQFLPVFAAQHPFCNKQPNILHNKSFSFTLYSALCT
jgi:hypothetical protein